MPPSTAAVHVSARRRPTLDGIGWLATEDALNDAGNAALPSLLDDDVCNALIVLYPQDRLFRSRVVMGRHGSGRSEYQCSTYLLPGLVAQLRTSLYPPLAAIVNRWNETMDIDVRCPAKYIDSLRCYHKAGQLRTILLMLQHGPGDYNCLHQDLYDEHIFPLQVTVLLLESGVDFSSGELVMTKQRLWIQSRPETVSLRKGDAVVFTAHHRPVQSARGTYRANIRHGVSRLCSGQWRTMGIIFHDTP